VDLIYKDEAYAIIGACFEVYNEIGCGFAEPVYQECLAIELHATEIPFQAQVEVPLKYKGKLLEKKHKPDFICFDKIVVEIKAVSELCNEHRAQVHHYLKATGFCLGLLVNFGAYPKLVYERIVR